MPDSSEAPAGNATRELAAIMFSDVVGYTAIMGRDEQKGVQAIGQHREQLRALLPKYNGRLLGEIGDGTLSSFHSVLEAISCAHELQSKLSNDPELRLRIGIHLGDVLLTANTVLGDGINVASRIHALAPPGGICISEHVYDEIRNKPGMRAKDLGVKNLKNVSRPIRVYSLTAMGPGGVEAHPAMGGVTRFLERRVLLRAAAIGGMIALSVFGLYRYYGQRMVAAWRIYLPRILPAPVEQNLAFCTTSDGVRIAYATSGKGPPLVFVVGWFTHLENGDFSPIYFGSALKELGKNFRVIRYDGRGSGLSDRAVRDYSLDARVRDLEAVIDTLKLNRVVLWAISAGGPAAIAYAARHPERVSRILLEDTYARIIHSAQDRQKWDAMITLIRTGWGSDNPAYRQMFTSLFMPDGSEADQRVWNEMERVSATPEDAAAFTTATNNIDVRNLAPKIRAPTLIIQVRNDQIVPLENGRELASLIPGARLAVIEGRDHVYVDGDGEEEQLVRELRPFLTDELQPPPPPRPR
jgi:pimeloyl-ACP methyl ester carboxylesterase/class 3 adenylate cyclase